MNCVIHRILIENNISSNRRENKYDSYLKTREPLNKRKLYFYKTIETYEVIASYSKL